MVFIAYIASMNLRLYHGFALQRHVTLILEASLHVICRVDYVLQAVVTYTTKLALEQAVAADKLQAEGVFLGDPSFPHINEPLCLIVSLLLDFIILLHLNRRRLC